MKQQLNQAADLFFIESEKNENKGPATFFNDYSTFLIDRDLPFELKSPYLMVGSHPLREGWVIYISVVRLQMEDLLDKVLEFLIASKCPFCIPENSCIHSMIIDGSLGYHLIGKVIALFPPNGELAATIANYLVSIAVHYRGVEIPTALPLSGCIYVEYENLAFFEVNDRIKTTSKPRPSAWPFAAIVPFCPPKQSKWVGGKYLKLQSLKNDAKGNVYKGLNLTRWTNIHWCIIKQGKRNQCMDFAGRDIRDRLKWQFEIHSTLSGLIPLPEPIDLFEEKGDTYFVMEFLEGKPYNNVISEIQKGVIWYKLPGLDQVRLLEYILQIIEILRLLHDNHYVHRDLNPVNFIITKDDKIKTIDLELCYNLLNEIPNPIFTLGTEGFMSPQQKRMDKPVKADDIYGIGAIMIRTLTGFSPTKLNINDEESLYRAINYFVRNSRLSSMICSCVSLIPEKRPDLLEVKHDIDLYIPLVLTGNQYDQNTECNACKVSPDNLIKQCLYALTQLPMIGREGTWYSKTIQEEELIANDLLRYSWYPGLYGGTSGIIYTIATSGQYCFELKRNREIFYYNFGLAKEHFNEHENCLSNPGLYSGAAGFAVVIATMIKQRLLENSEENINLIVHYLSMPDSLLNLSDGMAGKGIAIIKCSRLLKLPILAEDLLEIALSFIQQQNSDGSWLLKKDQDTKTAIKMHGLLTGISGIIYFLMIYGKLYANSQCIKAGVRGLNYLLKNRRPEGTWTVSKKTVAVDPWLEYGFTGIAFLFIKAFQHLQDPVYKEVASMALLTHPKEITSNYLGQANGLAGLGEVYLEAYTVFKDEEWKERAECILNFLNYSKYQANDQSVYWLDGSDSTPQASFGPGNSGILHFLLRFQKLDELEFPLIGIQH